MIAKFYTKRVSYELNITSKFNVIVGMSSTGKSRLVAFVKDLMADPVLMGKQPMRILSKEDPISYIEQYEDTVFVLDEGYTLGTWRKLVPIMKASRNYYIICSREGSAFIPYGVESTFILSGGPNHYKMISAYHKSRETYSGVGGIVCEDRGTGYLACSAIAEKYNMLCLSAEGRSNLRNTAYFVTKRQPDIVTVIVFDSCGIGCYYDSLRNLCNNFNIKLYISKSFEREVLDMFGFPELSVENIIKFDSEEDAYVQLLNVLLKDKVGIPYSKNNKELAIILSKHHGSYNSKFYDISSLCKGRELYSQLFESDGTDSTNVKKLTW